MNVVLTGIPKRVMTSNDNGANKYHYSIVWGNEILLNLP